MKVPGHRLLILLLLASGCQAAQTQPTLTFIHLNDTYRVDAVEEGRRGGFARVATIVRRLREQGNDVRILHAGDFLYPSLESQLWDGVQMVDALNFLDRLAPLYVVPGNHEFDPHTPEALIEALRQSEFDWLADNMHLATGDEGADASLHAGFTFRSGGRTIGIVALTLEAEDGGNVRDYAPVAPGYAEHAERAISALEAAGADLIIGLTHLYLWDDLALATLRRQHPAFRFIAGGHEHEPEFANEDGAATVMKGASNARTIWQIDVRFDGAGGQAEIVTRSVAVDESIPEDPGYQALERKWRARLLEKMPYLEAKIGVAAAPLDGREVTLRNVESNWADFIVDQMPGAFGEPAADLAFINSGTLRIDDFVTGDITFEDIGRTFGFSSYLNRMTMNGGDFVTLLEAGYRGDGPSKGYFPQVSGFRVCVDRARPEGQRIVQMQVPADGGWKDIDRSKDYQLVATDFIYRGGDGYDFSKARDVSRPGSELKYRVLDAVLRAQVSGKKIGRPVDPEKPRFALLPAGEELCFR